MKVPETPLVRIRPPRRWEALDLRALWSYRDLLWALALRDIRLRYRQTVLGVLWVVLQPLLGAGIFAFVFGRVARLDSGGVPYLHFTYTGLLVWNLFSTTVLKASTAMVSNATLISKVAFPRLLLPFSAAVSGLVDFAIGLVAGIILIFSTGSHPHWSIFAAPLWLALLILLALGVGLISGALAVAYRDVVHVMPVALQLLLYASPVGYTIAVIPEGWPRLLYKLNPLAPLLEGFRSAFLGQGFVGQRSALYAIVMALLVFLAGLIFFRHRERQFADVI